MKRIIFYTALLLTHSLLSRAQNTSEEAALNRDIWKPFIEGVNTNQPDLYNGVNATDFLWVSGGAKPRVMNLDEYIEDARVVMKSRSDKGTKTFLEVRFSERQVNKETAAEKVLVRYVSTEQGKDPVTFYGAVHVFSRKRDGMWKKVLQYALPEVVTAADFEKARPLD